MCRVFWAFKKGKITSDFRGLLLEGSCKHRASKGAHAVHRKSRGGDICAESWRMSRSLTDRELFEKFTVLRHLWASLHGFTIISLVSKYLTSIITTCYFPFYPFTSILFCCLVYSPVFAKVCSNFLEMFSQ